MLGDGSVVMSRAVRTAVQVRPLCPWPAAARRGIHRGTGAAHAGAVDAPTTGVLPLNVRPNPVAGLVEQRGGPDLPAEQGSMPPAASLPVHQATVGDRDALVWPATGVVTARLRGPFLYPLYHGTERRAVADGDWCIMAATWGGRRRPDGVTAYLASDLADATGEAAIAPNRLINPRPSAKGRMRRRSPGIAGRPKPECGRGAAGGSVTGLVKIHGYPGPPVAYCSCRMVYDVPRSLTTPRSGR